MHEELGGCANVGELFARGAELACASCDFSRGLALTVGERHLTATDSGALRDPPSDRLRRKVLAAPIALEPKGLEANLVRGRSTGAPSAEPSQLAESLGLDRFVVAAIAPGQATLGLLVVDRSDPDVGDVDWALVEVFASIMAVELERVVQRTRVVHLASEVRQFQAASRALTRELLDGPVELRGNTLSPLMKFDGITGEGPRPSDLLSEAELRIAPLLLRGRSNQQIASELVLSAETVKTHVARLLRKLGAANRTEAVYRLMRLGGIEGNSPDR